MVIRFEVLTTMTVRILYSGMWHFTVWKMFIPNYMILHTRRLIFSGNHNLLMFPPRWVVIILCPPLSIHVCAFTVFLQFCLRWAPNLKFLLGAVDLINNLRTSLNRWKITLRLMTLDYWTWTIKKGNLKSRIIKWGFHCVFPHMVCPPDAKSPQWSFTSVQSPIM